MKKEREAAKEFLSRFTGYIAWGAGKLGKKFNLPPEIIKEIKREIKYENKSFRRLFFDIETSYNITKSWSTGWNKTINPGDIIKERAVICISWKWEGESTVHNLTWDKNQCDKQLLIDFNKVLEKADEVIGHNGDRFDIPWLRTRCLYHRIPFRTYIKSLDTLKKVKGVFNFQSNKLDYIADFLGYGHKLKTSMELWDDIILHKDAKALIKMVEYCNHDVVLLEDVFVDIQPYIKPNVHRGVAQGKSKCTCPNCESSNTKLIGNQFTALGTIKRHLACKDCTTDFIVSNTAYINRHD